MMQYRNLTARFWKASIAHRATWRGMACMLLLALSGCRIPGLCCADPAPPLPDTFNGAVSPDSSAQTGIIEFFDDPVLTSLIIQGLIRNQDIQIASNEVQAARGAYLPFLSLDARGGVERTSKFTPLGAAEEQLTT